MRCKILNSAGECATVLGDFAHEQGLLICVTGSSSRLQNNVEEDRRCQVHAESPAQEHPA
eukprot:4977023-Amphidinium_carterae.1